MSKLIALIDIDGTLADYSGSMIKALNEIKSPDESFITKIEDPPLWLDKRMDIIKSKPGFWRNLPILPLGFAIVDLLREANFKLNVLTKGPKLTTSAWSEKVEWCRSNLPSAQITITEDKSNVYGKVLVDDWPNYIEKWLKWRPRGTVFMPSQPWNKDFSHPQVVKVHDSSEDLIVVKETLDTIINKESK